MSAWRSDSSERPSWIDVRVAEDVRLHLVESRGFAERVRSDTGPSREVVYDRRLAELHELVVDDDPGDVVYDADARELLAVFREALEGTINGQTKA